MPFDTRVIQIDPRAIKLLDLNARFMRHEVFSRLVENIRADGRLTQIPFAWSLHDDDTQTPILDENGDPIYEVLSGNHRVQAAVAAGLETIDLQVTDDYLTPNQRKAIQLSHNAITGEDDPATLKVIYDSIEDVSLRLYAGLDDKQLDLLRDVVVTSLSEPNLDFQTVTLAFLPMELDAVKDAFDAALKTASGSKGGVWLARWAEYDALLDALTAASTTHNVKNTATALMLVLEVFSRHVSDLAEGLIMPDGTPTKDTHHVPIETVLGTTYLPAKLAGRLTRAINRMLTDRAIDKDARYEALEKLLDAYEGD